MIGGIIKTISSTSNAISARIATDLLGDPKADKVKVSCKTKLKELEKKLTEKKDKLSKTVYFDTKSKISSYSAKITQTSNPDKLNEYDKEIEKLLKKI
jgi:hypothetical protein